MSELSFSIVPVLEYIGRNIKTTLNNITIANGYTFDMTFERELARGNKPANMKGVIFQLDPSEQPTQAYGYKEWVQPYEIEIYLRQSEDDDTPVATFKNLVFADVSKALMVDPTRGDKAEDTQIMGYSNFSNLDGSGEGIIVSVDVKYRTAERNPYTT